MKNSMLFRIISIFLVILMLASALTACQPAEGPSKGSEGESTPAPGESPQVTSPPSIPEVTADTAIIEGGATKYKIVRAELAADYEKTMAGSLATFFTDSCGVSLSVSDDWVNEALGYTESECEILIGKTNRTESVLVYNNLRADDYAVTVVNKKIVIAAYTEEKLSEAISYFTGKLQKGEGSATLLASDVKVEYGVYGISSITVNGASLSNYKIVYKAGTGTEIKAAAELLAAELKDKYSYVIGVSTDAVEETPYEIIIGGTSRGSSQTLTDTINSFDYYVSVEDNRILIIPGANAETPEKAVNAFVEKLAAMANGGKIEITPDTLNIKLEETYPTKDITLNGHPISEYTIIYKNNDTATAKMALRLRDEIDKTCGRRLTVASDSQSYRNTKEILVGATNRTEGNGAATGVKEKLKSAKQGDYLMYLDGDFFIVGGNDYVATMGAINKLIAAITDVKDAANHTVSFEVSTAAPVNQTTYKVFTYNDGDNSTTNLAQVSAVITDYAPDIVGMQEVQKAHVPAYELRLKTYKGIYYDHDTYYDGAPIFYNVNRFDLVESGTQWLSSTPDEKYSKFSESEYIRSYVYAILKDKATGEEIVVINTHVDYVDAANKKQIAVLLECTEKFRGKPIIYTGDFNMKNTSDGYKQMYASGLRDCGSYLGYNIQGHIDFCFIDQAYVVATAYKYVDDHKYSSSASDHCPVYSEIVLAS